MEASSNILAPLTLGSDINKNKNVSSENQEGLVREEDEMELKTPDEEIIKLCKEWENRWKLHKAESLIKKWETNTKYWKGDLDSNSIRKLWRGLKTNNIIFIAQETYLNMVTMQDPEPYVLCQNDDEGNQLAHDITAMVQYLQRRELKLKTKIKQLERFRDMYYIGIAKMIWDKDKNEIGLEIKRPQKMILDPDATVTDCEYDGEYIGEYREEYLSTLKEWFPEKKEFLENKAKDKEGSKMGFIEYWTKDLFFYKMDDEILGKYKNPMWNWDKKEKIMQMDMNGEEQEVENVTHGKNYFKNKKMPYLFLVVYNLGQHPYDETSTMEQCITLQNMANDRLEQIDKNIKKVNGGLIVNGTYFTTEQCKMLSDAVQDGGTIRSEAGADDITKLVMPITGASIPESVYENLLYLENAIRNLYGVGGSTSEGLKQEKSVRGKIMAGNVDAQRNSGPAEYIEQFVTGIYEWLIQMIFVFYDEPHFATVLGQEKVAENVQLMNTDLFDKSITISVKQGSLLPKDPMTEAQQALDLFTAGALDLITLFERLDFANPKQVAERIIAMKLDPVSYVQGLTVEQIQQMQQQNAQVQAGGQPQIQLQGQSTPQGNTAPQGQPEIPTNSQEPNLLNQVPVVQ